jgi:pimeloyl-ACP methyl ester carboxylesterase
MTLDRIARDGVALAEVLRSQLGVRRIVLMATSGGSAIGLKMIKARPDLFSAYVGNGQIVDWVKQEALAYAMILNRAKQAGDDDAIAEIEGIGPPPWTDVADVAAKAKYANAMTGRERDAFAKLPVAAVGAPPPDATWVARGLPRVDPVALSTATYEALRGEIETFDARALGLRYDVPIVILQGAEDAHTVTSEVTAWFGELHAPSKVLSILPDAGHMSIFLVDELKARLDRHVRPLALSTAAGS